MRYPADDQNPYKIKLLKYLHDQNEKAVSELQETSPLTLHFQNDIKQWYQSLISLINNNPPDYWVRCLHIFENDHGQISKILYEYQTDSSDLSNASDVSEIIHSLY